MEGQHAFHPQFFHPEVVLAVGGRGRCARYRGEDARGIVLLHGEWIDDINRNLHRVESEVEIHLVLISGGNPPLMRDDPHPVVNLNPAQEILERAAHAVQ